MNYSVLVLSCDKYTKVLDRFFQYYKRFFKADLPLFLSLEQADYHYEELDITVLHSDADNWSLRIIQALRQIDTKAVLILLDDFIIESPVDQDELEKLSDLINNDDTIAHFALTTVPMKNVSDTIFYDRYYQRDQYGRYKTTLQAGMWNRKELLSVLKDGESPWEVEVFANIRSYLSNRNYYAIAKKSWKPINYNDGLFCVQGRLNEAELTRLSKKFGEDFHIEGMQSDGGIIVRDKRPFFRRIKTRLRIIIYEMYYHMLAMKGKRLEKE